MRMNRKDTQLLVESWRRLINEGALDDFEDNLENIKFEIEGKVISLEEPGNISSDELKANKNQYIELFDKSSLKKGTHIYKKVGEFFEKDLSGDGKMTRDLAISYLSRAFKDKEGNLKGLVDALRTTITNKEDENKIKRKALDNLVYNVLENIRERCKNLFSNVAADDLNILPKVGSVGYASYDIRQQFNYEQFIKIAGLDHDQALGKKFREKVNEGLEMYINSEELMSMK